MYLNLKHVRQLLGTLNDAEFEAAADWIGCWNKDTSTPDTEVPELDQFRFFLWEWLAHLGFISDAQIRYIVRLNEVTALGRITLQQAHSVRIGQPMLAAPHYLMTHDLRWLTVLLGNDMLRHDLRLLKPVPLDTSAMSVTIITLNGVSLVLRNWALAEKLYGGQSAESTDAGTTQPAEAQPPGAAEAAER